MRAIRITAVRDLLADDIVVTSSQGATTCGRRRPVTALIRIGLFWIDSGVIGARPSVVVNRSP